MTELTVSGMTCGGCAQAVTRSIQKKDPNAKVTVDLKDGKVSINSILTPEELAGTITKAGYQVTKTQTI